MILSEIIPNLKKLLYSHLYYTNQYIYRSNLKKFYKYQTIFYSHEINAQYNEFNILGDNKNKKFKKINNLTEEYKKNIINSNDYMITQKNIEKLYSNPINDLTNIYILVNREFNKQCIFYTYTNLTEMKIKCIIEVTWPRKACFSSIALQKKIATKNAALQCLNWLYECNKIKGLKPILYDPQNMNNLLNSQKYLNIDLISDLKIEIQSLIDNFDNEIKSITTMPCTKNNREDNLEEIVNEKEDNLNANLLDFNQIYYNRFKNSKQKMNQNQNLPVIDYKEEILNNLQNNQVLVIKGDTGCGKSTQIPQFILDACKEQNKICNIIVVEPRRISTVSLAYRIAQERGENIGNTIGYHIRFEKKEPKNEYGSILYCTIGIFLQKLKHKDLKGISHIIIDEAHERNLQIDIILKSLKDILKHNSHIKLVIMSATINAEIFQQYFSSALINIPGKLYDVKMHFIDDIHFLFKDNLLDLNMKKEIPFDKIVNLIAWIIKNKPRGAILCFLPGWQEIKYLHDMLQETKMNDLLILPLHSKIPMHIQKNVFKEVPNNNVTKIILATDIAETGITIKDIRYVIDTAIKRDTQWNENKSLFNLNFNHISQANILQRKGRAGRVQSGESYHLITRSEYDKLDLYPKPEILKAPLDQAIIMCKILSDEKIYDFFNDMIDSPNKNTIISTVNTLKNLGILDDDENLTNLGKYISYISLTPKLSKAIILSCIFQCLNPIVFIVTAFSTISHSVSLDEISNIRTISKNNKLKYHKTSDHIAVLEYFNNLKKDNLFSSIFNSDTKNFNNHETIKFVQRLCIVHINELINSKMISFLCDFNYLNKNSKNNELIRAVLFSATNNLIKRNAYGYKKTYFTHQANNLIIENNDMVKLKAESVNYNQKKWPSDLLTYIDKMDYAMRYSCLISDTSMISPLSVLLFSTADVQCEKIQDSFTKKEKIIITINDIKNINFICELETADLLLKLRNILWNVVNYIIEYENRDEGNNLKSVKLFKEHLMDLILKILTESSRDIDEFDDKNKDIIEQ